MPRQWLPVDGWSDKFRYCAQRTTHDAWCGEHDPAAEMLSRRAYHASVAFVDEQIGKVHAALRATGLLRSTLWVFTSDHGDGQGDHWHWRKGYPYEFSAHVPMLIRWPDDPTVWPAGLPPPSVTRGATVDALVELRDVAPTLLHAAGALPSNASRTMDGASMLCLLRPRGDAVWAALPGCPAAGWRATLSLEHDICYNASNHWSAITDGASKYVFEAQHGQEQLFDLNKDPRETRDVSGDPAYSSTLSKLRADLVAQYRREERGPNWVMGNKLVPRPKGQLYSPNYPGVVRRRMSRTFLTHDTAKR